MAKPKLLSLRLTAPCRARISVPWKLFLPCLQDTVVNLRVRPWYFTEDDRGRYLFLEHGWFKRLELPDTTKLRYAGADAKHIFFDAAWWPSDEQVTKQRRKKVA